MTKKGNITVSDVARRAGVSTSTVSRVISDNPRISQATKDRVLKIMDEMGYYPNVIARSLAKKQTGNIGVIMPTRSEDVFLNPFFPEALRGILKGACKNDYDILLSTNTEKGDELENIKSLIRGSKVDGIILVSSKVDDESIKYLSSIEFPFSLIGSPYELANNINHVDNDNYMAAYELTKYLIKTGKRVIAMIAGDDRLVVTLNRINGYKQALEDSNISFNEELLFIGSFNEETGYKYGKDIIKLKSMPDALIVTDDLVTFGAIQVLESFNINIPMDMSVASFNNSIISRHSAIPFTSVDINAYELGLQSVNLVATAIEKDTRGMKITIPYKIYKRESTEVK